MTTWRIIVQDMLENGWLVILEDDYHIIHEQIVKTMDEVLKLVKEIMEAPFNYGVR